MCRFCHLLGTRREISVQILHLSFLSVHCIQRRKRTWLFWHVPLTIIPENSNGNISTLLGLCQVRRQCKSQCLNDSSQSCLTQSFPMGWTAVPASEMFLFWCIWMYIHVYCITLHYSLECPKANRRLEYPGWKEAPVDKLLGEEPPTSSGRSRESTFRDRRTNRRTHRAGQCTLSLGEECLPLLSHLGL